MRSLIRLFVFALAMCVLAPTAFADGGGNSQQRIIYSNPANLNNRQLLSGIALNATQGTRTITLPIAGRNRVSIQVNLTRVAATTLTMQCKASVDGGFTFGDITDQIVTAGNGQITPHVWTETVSGNTNTVLDLWAGTYDSLQCFFGGASAGGSDLITVYAIGGSGP